jgi:hypothetical protein
MAFIPFPDVPDVPGVPNVPRQIGAITPDAGDELTSDSAIYNPAPQWAIVDSTGDAALSPDSVVELEYRGEMRICSHPVEQGSFASYNKIAVPFDVRVVLSCNGNGPMSRDQFLSAIETMRESTDLVSIVTPDDVYQNCNLVHVDYRRDARQGVSLILVQLWFQEVRQGSSTTTSTAQPDGADSSQQGQVSPVNPSTQQQSAYNDTAIT